jgi:hypothetical protein
MAMHKARPDLISDTAKTIIFALATEIEVSETADKTASQVSHEAVTEVNKLKCVPPFPLGHQHD